MKATPTIGIHPTVDPFLNSQDLVALTTILKVVHQRSLQSKKNRARSQLQLKWLAHLERAMMQKAEWPRNETVSAVATT